MDVFRYKPFTGPKISESQGTMIAIFPKKGKKKHFPTIAFQENQQPFSLYGFASWATTFKLLRCF